MAIKFAKFGFSALTASSAKLRISKVFSELCDLELFLNSVRGRVSHH